jgi:glycerol-3-phosphate O-acyltransferase
LKEFFKNEFVYDSYEDIQEEINKITSYFLDVSFITRTNMNGGFKLTRLGFDNLPIWAAMAKTFLESYWIVIQSLIQLENKKIKTANLLKNTNHLAQRFHKLGLIDHVEAISQLNFKNAIAFINKNFLESLGTSEKERSQNKEKLSQLNQRLYKLSHYSA